MASQVYFHLLISLIISACEAWKCAKYEHYFSQQPDYIDCFWDCCGNSFNRHCCAPIGIIVGCCIIGAVVVAALVVVLSCWWQRRRARVTKGPRLFHNRRHSHYPVAPTSVTRPAPNMEKSPYGPPSDSRGYGPPPSRGYGPPPNQGYQPPPDHRSEKPPIDDFYNERPTMTSTMGRGGPPARGGPGGRGGGPPPSRGPPRQYRDDPHASRSASEYSDFEQRGPPRGGYRPAGPAPASTRPVQPPPNEFLEL